MSFYNRNVWPYGFIIVWRSLVKQGRQYELAGPTIHRLTLAYRPLLSDVITMMQGVSNHKHLERFLI